MPLLNDIEHLPNPEEFLGLLKKSSIEVGMVEFREKEDNNPISSNFLEIASFELDIIAYELTHKKIVLLDHDNIHFKMQEISESFNNFINALIIIENFFERCEVNESLYYDYSEMEIVAKKASKYAGGIKYLDFYKCMLGIKLFSEIYLDIILIFCIEKKLK